LLLKKIFVSTILLNYLLVIGIGFQCLLEILYLITNYVNGISKNTFVAKTFAC